MEGLNTFWVCVVNEQRSICSQSTTAYVISDGKKKISNAEFVFPAK